MGKKTVRFVIIALPLAILLVQILMPTDPLHEDRMQHAIEAVVPVMGLVFRYIDFNQKNALSKWEEKAFDGKVAYWIDFDQTSGFVHSKSMSAASAIFYRLKYNLDEFPFISWKWKVKKFPKKSVASDAKKKDDYAARFYIVFLSRFFTNFRCVEYVWDETIAEETILESPYSNQIKQLVVQSGLSKDDWVVENRNVFKDYEKLFGEKPTLKVAAVALMTDAEGTGSEAEAFFDDIRIGKEAKKL